LFKSREHGSIDEFLDIAFWSHFKIGYKFLSFDALNMDVNELFLNFIQVHDMDNVFLLERDSFILNELLSLEEED
jgi:hypothetical protein